MKTNLKIIGLVILMVVVTSCKKMTDKIGKPENFDYGTIENNVYKNTFFNLVMNLPKDWNIQSQVQLEQIANLGKDMISENNEDLKKAIKASEINTANLLGLFRYEIGSNVDSYNQNLMMAAENIGMAKITNVINSPEDYMNKVKEVLQQTGMNYTFNDGGTKKSVNGHEFYTSKASMDYAGMKIKQEFYITIINDFALGITLSYVTDKQKEELYKIFNTIKVN